MFYFTRSERRRIIFFIFVLLCWLTAIFFYNIHKKNVVNTEIDSLKISKETLKKSSYDKSNPKKLISNYIPIRFHKYDPNQCDSIDLIELGLKPWQAHMFLQYRRGGAVFYSRKQIERVYGLNEENIETLSKWAVFPTKKHSFNYPKNNGNPQEASKQVKNVDRNTFNYEHVKKITAGESVDLSKADTSDLKKVPGIGSYYARRIKEYEKQLGGYVSVLQLLEINGFPKESVSYFTLSDKSTIKLSLNSSDFKSLVRHPYLSYEQVKTIFNHRRKYGKITNITQLSTEPSFSDEDIARIKPYVKFEE